MCSIIIPAFNAEATLGSVLSALAENDDIDRCEVVVVDDGSTDNTVSEARTALHERNLQATIVQQPNVGPAGARNAGVSSSSAPVLMFLGADVVPSPSLVSEHIAFHEQHPEPEAALVGPYWFEEHDQHTEFVRWFNRGGSPLLSPPWTNLDDDCEVDGSHFLTGNASLKRRLFERVNGFDTSFPSPAFEDIEMGLRLKTHGMRLFYRERASAVHRHEITFRELLGRMREIGYSAHLLKERTAREGEPPPPATSLFRQTLAKAMSPIGRAIGSDRLAFAHISQRLHREFVRGYETRAAEVMSAPTPDRPATS